MAFYRNYRRRWYGRRYGGRRYWRRNWYRRNGVGMSYSQKQGTRRFSLMIPVEGSVSVSYAAPSQSTVIGLSPFYYDTSAGVTQNCLNSQMSIMQNPLFQMYVRLYDEMKINGVVYKFRVSGVPNQVTAGSIYTSIDRHATAHDLSVAKSYDEVVNGVEHQRFDFTSTERAIFTRSFWSRDLMEKAQFVDSTSHSTANYPVQGVTATVVEDWFTMGRGGFIPLLYLCANSAGFTQAAHTMTIDCTVNYYMTFRNPKFKTAVDRSVRSEPEAEPVATKAVESRAGKFAQEMREPLDPKYAKMLESLELSAEDEATLNKYQIARLARKKARLEKVKKLRALEKELEKDDDTLIDPEEEVLPDDDLLMDDDDDVPTQPIKELENKSSS